MAPRCRSRGGTYPVFADFTVRIVSNDGANTTAARLGRGALTVAPMTSNIARVYPFQVLVPAESSGLESTSGAGQDRVGEQDRG